MGTSPATPAFESVAFHADLAPGWEQRYAKKSFRARIAALEECLCGENLAGSNWLDAGCGTGTLSRWLAERGCDVLGVDAAPTMVAKADELSSDWGASRRPSFAHIETIQRIPVESARFDGILCSSVLEYVDDPAGCLAEFARVLKPGGLLLVSVPNRDSIVRQAQVACHRLGERVGLDWLTFLRHSRHQYRAGEFRELLSQRGMVTKKIISFGSPLPHAIQRLSFGGSLLMFKASKLDRP
jgi:2-polyprenyl-3-methyl-5-hydroxy-6-metoxy-1,4-benzoquinol methylase